jgi:hypothetical protein
VQIGYSVDRSVAAAAAYQDIDLIVGGHSHTFLFGAPAPAGQPQLPTSPGPLLSGSTRESTVAEGPYPTLVLNGGSGRGVPVTTALWGSRYIGDLLTVWDAEGNLESASGSPVLLGGANSANPVPGGVLCGRVCEYVLAAGGGGRKGGDCQAYTATPNPKLRCLISDVRLTLLHPARSANA